VGEHGHLAVGLRCFIALTGELLNALATFGQHGLLDEQGREAVADGEGEAAALAEEAFAVEVESGVAGVERTAEDGQEVGTDHGRALGASGAA
jgi:hypothetical protein